MDHKKFTPRPEQHIELPEDISKACSKCPILLKELGIVKNDVAIIKSTLNKLDELINHGGLMPRLETLERNSDAILKLLTQKTITNV